MGDRANIVIRDSYEMDNHEAVFLYSDRGGTELPEILRVALDRRERWDDCQYLSRIIFDAMIGDEQGEETGYGLSTRLGDNEYPLLVLTDQRVYLLSEQDYKRLGFAALTDDSANTPWLSFDEYVSVAERTWENVKSGVVAA